MRRIIVVSLSLVSGERNLIHKPLATCCNFSSCTCEIYVDTREIYLELNSGGSELRCSSDCGSRVVRSASEGNLETPTDCMNFNDAYAMKMIFTFSIL